jgi:predicted RNA binding protein YcfA (HicA-like mRNA interferase family)
MSHAVPSSVSRRKGKMSNLPAPICARPSSCISKLGALRTAGPLKLPSSGLPSKFPADMPKLPSLSGERVVKALRRTGFVQLRQRGSHVSLEKRIGDKVWKTVVPMHSELAKGTLADILKQCGLTLAEFLELL